MLTSVMDQMGGSPQDLQEGTQSPDFSQVTVGDGDSLWSLAQRLYGDPLQWKKLYELNRDSIGPNPNMIRSGSKLRLR